MEVTLRQIPDSVEWADDNFNGGEGLLIRCDIVDHLSFPPYPRQVLEETASQIGLAIEKMELPPENTSTVIPGLEFPYCLEYNSYETGYIRRKTTRGIARLAIGNFPPGKFGRAGNYRYVVRYHPN